MLSKRVLDALREEFHEEFGELSVRDEYIRLCWASISASRPGPTWSGIFLIPSSQSAFWKRLGSWKYRLSLAPVILRDNGGCDMRT